MHGPDRTAKVEQSHSPRLGRGNTTSGLGLAVWALAGAVFSHSFFGPSPVAYHRLSESRVDRMVHSGISC